MGIEKACGVESDHIGSLILASRGDFSESKIQKNVSVGATPVGKSTSPVDKGASAFSTGTDVHVPQQFLDLLWPTRVHQSLLLITLSTRTTKSVQL